MDWLLSITSLVMLYLMGRRSKWGPVVGLVSQIVWLVWVIRINQVGLMIGVVAFAVIHAWNLYKWWRPETHR